MNCEVCELTELDVEEFEIREVLRCTLHTILFHRALGLIRPKDIDCELFDLTYVQCGIDEVEKEIEEKIDEFIIKINKHPTRRIQICVSFYETKQSPWYSSKNERIYWERWYINLHVINQKTQIEPNQNKVDIDPGEFTFEERELHRAELEASLREILFRIIKFVNEKRDHLPPIPPSIEGASFPCEISILSSSDSSFRVLKRMLQTGHQTMLS